ncbi:MAG: hypothetical protein OHK0046_50880 [Anaerolineae bacterium]
MDGRSGCRFLDAPNYGWVGSANYRSTIKHLALNMPQTSLMISTAGQQIQSIWREFGAEDDIRMRWHPGDFFTSFKFPQPNEAVARDTS